MNQSTPDQPPSAIAVENSENSKIGRASATYASQASCPSDCPLLGQGCYAEQGKVGIIARRLARTGARGPLAIAQEEARAIDRLSGQRPLRLHVVGDASTDEAARALAAACLRYTRRGGGRVWTYTHAWKRVQRASWGAVSVLASCERPRDARAAMRRGYAAAMVVPAFERQSACRVGGLTVIPCPWQTRGVACERCRLCFDDRRLRERRLVIGFSAHGPLAGAVRRVLVSLPVIA